MKQKLRHKIYHGTQLGKPQILLLTTKLFFYKLQILEDVFFLLDHHPLTRLHPQPIYQHPLVGGYNPLYYQP